MQSDYSSFGGSGPTLMSRGNDQFGVFVNAANNVVAVKFNRASRTTGTQWDLSTIPGNPLALPLDRVDPHEAPSIAVDATGYIWIAANMWGTLTPRFIRSTNPLDVSSWINVSGQIPQPDTAAEFSYFHFARFSDGGLILFVHHRPGDGDPRREGYMRRLYLAPGSTTWTDRGYLCAGANDGTTDAFYQCRPVIDRNDRIHIMGAWRLTDDGQGGLQIGWSSYFYSNDRGITWRNIAGTLLTGLPISRTNAAGVAVRTNIPWDATPTNYVMAGAALDRDGYPCFTYMPLGTPARIVRWNGLSWIIDPNAGWPYLTGGSYVNLVNWRGDLWTFCPRTTSPPIDRLELRRVASPNEVVPVATGIPYPPGGQFMYADPVALMKQDQIEVIVADIDSAGAHPKVYTVGDHHRVSSGQPQDPPNIHVVPLSINSTGVTPVGAALTSWFASQVDGASIQFQPGGIYNVTDAVVAITNKVGLDIDLNGATLRRATLIPQAMRYPNDGSYITLESCQDITIRNGFIDGLNANDGTHANWSELISGLYYIRSADGTAYQIGPSTGVLWRGLYCDALAFEMGVRIVGGARIMVQDMNIDGVFGDHVYIRGGGSNVTVERLFGRRNGRQGIGMNGAANVLVTDCDIASNRGAIDIEPTGGAPNNNIEISDNILQSGLLPLANNGSGPCDNIRLLRNTINQSYGQLMSCVTAARYARTNYQIIDNICTYNLGGGIPSIEAMGVVGAVISGNRLRKGGSGIGHPGIRFINKVCSGWTVTNNDMTGSNVVVEDQIGGSSWVNGGGNIL